MLIITVKNMDLVVIVDSLNSYYPSWHIFYSLVFINFVVVMMAKMIFKVELITRFVYSRLQSYEY